MLASLQRLVHPSSHLYSRRLQQKIADHQVLPLPPMAYGIWHCTWSVMCCTRICTLFVRYLCFAGRATAVDDDKATTAEHIFVSPNSGLDLTSLFSCEGGEFDVFWSGVVNVPGTIYIGRGTTVRIFGELPADGNGTNGSAKDIDQRRVEALSTRLPPLPNNLTSAAVSTASHHQTNQSTTTTTSSAGGEGALAPAGAAGPIFFIDGGQLFLERLAVRGGVATNYTEASSSDGSGNGGGSSGSEAVTCGGGVHAVDANVTVAGCEFEDNFSEYLGGGIFTNRSTLVVTASVFRRCQAGVQSFPGDDAFGAGGGVGVRFRFEVRGIKNHCLGCVPCSLCSGIASFKGCLRCVAGASERFESFDVTVILIFSARKHAGQCRAVQGSAGQCRAVQGSAVSSSFFRTTAQYG